MTYAPIMIPTLNRIEHLKRCIESLLRNREADKTELYISVDYPPSDKYRTGYKEVLDYVKTIKGFASVNIYYQDKNLGPGLNEKFLEKKIAEKFDTFIFTEDDNEFSSDFLAYMNWGLETFKNDDSIYVICSGTDFKLQTENVFGDYFIMPTFNPYGTGYWIKKIKKCEDYLVDSNIEKIYKNHKKQNLLLKYSPALYMYVALDSLRKIRTMRGKNDNITFVDIWQNVYMVENDLRCIKPVIPKSRNWGRDGSGIHSNVKDKKDYVPDVILGEAEWPLLPVCNDSLAKMQGIEAHKKSVPITKREKRVCWFIFLLNRILGNRLTNDIYRKFYLKKSEFNKEETIFYG